METPSFIARGNITMSRFVKLDTATDNGVLQAGTNERVFGIASEAGRESPIPALSTMYAAQDGDNLHVYGPGQNCLLELGDTVAAGDLLKSDTDGKGVPAATSGATAQEVGALALQAGAAGAKIRVRVSPIPKFYPALS